ncbi:HAD family hydrolase [Ralstonia pseudosolanacearum]|uniref:Putative type III effector protein n=2 Tax=Ralstonia solanacearum TaxID=305 RepID=A0A0S4WLJ1_RALSL|nr:HAD family hydrolase [Ralstonia pseudosolanacearum]CUV47527.1 putative type III effector protein [Ralstonia solanacearum]MDO3507745.1 XopC/Rsp1239 family type III secretion system effector [Ralstonia pseudosolanacearum]MDO3514997.1 XopC/Rsp1239 family type III secretion system effector [Ralstonia pseudosolanacearum]MDO3530087.1 XopC/Rsp1239 family type III secretion system effector [Ralstonia pseudosolanacearum]MDO3534953.1 XopC/Rsp1239 family type III secretion system effector [Ralstonia p
MTLIKSASTSSSIPQTVADNSQKQLPLPVGKNSPIPRAASSAARQSLPKAPVETWPAGPTANRQALDRMISENREAPASKGAFRLTSKHLGSAKRAEAQEYHQRMETKAPVFFSEFATEKPALSMVEALHQGKRDYYAVRHVGKRGRDLYTDAPIAGNDSRIGPQKTSPQLSTQSSGTRAIRGFAATATIDQARGEYIARLHQHVVNMLGGEGGVVHLVRPSRDPYVEDSTLNFFTFCEQAELASSLNALEAKTAKQNNRSPIVFTDNKSLIGLSRTSRTEASPIGRLVQQPFFVTSELRAGDKVVLADDHIQAGGSMLAMESAARGAGADVLAFATLSTHPFSPQLTMSPEVRDFLDQTLAAWDPENLVSDRLAQLGMPHDRLTNSEAMILIAYAISPDDAPAVAKFQAMQATFFERAHLHNVGINPDAPDAADQLHQLQARQNAANTDTARAFISNAHVLEGEHDSLIPVLNEKPKSPQEIVQELDNVSRSSRESVAASDIKQVAVLDWDDCLRDEKGLNYQLMHNALAVAAREHAQTLPELGEALSRLQARMQSGQPAGEGDPLLMKSRENFTAHLMTNPSIFKRHIVQDFVRTMLPDAAPDKAKSLVNAVYTQFTREYERATQPQQNNNLRDVPFPNVQFEMMPGALELLEKCRTADTRVILISNRGHADLEDEVNRLGMMHYFDAVSGAPLVTQPKPGAQPAQMPEELQTRLTQALQGDDSEALRQALNEASIYAHPDTTVVDRTDKKPGATRLLQSLEQLSVPANVPITSYGDQPSDVKQLQTLVGQGRHLEGVIINPQHNDVGQQIDVAGIPTRVVRSMEEL